MAKQVLITFNQDGSLLQADSSAVGIRKGDSNGEVTIRAVFQNRRNDSYVAKFHFERPDGKKQRNIIMLPSSTDSNEYDYAIGSAWFFAVPGTAKVTVTITDGTGAIAAQGSYGFNVEATQVDVVDSTLTYDEAAALEGLIANLSQGMTDHTIESAHVELISSGMDGNTYELYFILLNGERMDAGHFFSRNGNKGTSIASVQEIPSTLDGGDNTVRFIDENGNLVGDITVKNGSKGSPALGNVGLIFMVVSDDPASPYYYGTLGLSSSMVGHLVLNYPDGSTPPNVKLVSDDPNSDSYYVTLGVPSSMVGHLLYFNN